MLSVIAPQTRCIILRTSSHIRNLNNNRKREMKFCKVIWIKALTLLHKIEILYSTKQMCSAKDTMNQTQMIRVHLYIALSKSWTPLRVFRTKRIAARAKKNIQTCKHLEKTLHNLMRPLNPQNIGRWKVIKASSKAGLRLIFILNRPKAIVNNLRPLYWLYDW